MGIHKSEFPTVENSALIDAATFANLFSAFWRSVTPTCELFVRRLNLGETERFQSPIASDRGSSSAALLAEVGFSRFAILVERSELVRDPAKLFELALDEAKRRLRAFEASGLDLDPVLSLEDCEYAVDISNRLGSFFRSRGGTILVRPKFIGCGYIDTSEGDVICNRTLYEVKTVERGFRSVDIQQLITYYSLAIAAGETGIRNVGLVNPKRGLSFEIGVDELSQEIAGVSSSDLANEVIRAVSSGDISR